MSQQDNMLQKILEKLEGMDNRLTKVENRTALNSNILEDASVKVGDLTRSQVNTETNVADEFARQQVSFQKEINATKDRQLEFEEAVKKEVSYDGEKILQEESQIEDLTKKNLKLEANVQELAKTVDRQIQREVEDAFTAEQVTAKAIAKEEADVAAIQTKLNWYEQKFAEMEARDQNKDNIIGQLQAERAKANATINQLMIDVQTIKDSFTKHQSDTAAQFDAVQRAPVNSPQAPQPAYGPPAPTLREIAANIPKLIVSPRDRRVTAFQGDFATASIPAPTSEMQIVEPPPVDITGQLLKIQSFLKSKKVKYSEWILYLLECCSSDVQKVIPDHIYEWHELILFFFKYTDFAAINEKKMKALQAIPKTPKGKIQDYLVRVMRAAQQIEFAGSYRIALTAVRDCLPYMPMIKAPDSGTYNTVELLMDFVMRDISPYLTFPSDIPSTTINQVTTKQANTKPNRPFIHYFCPRCHCTYCQSDSSKPNARQGYCTRCTCVPCQQKLKNRKVKTVHEKLHHDTNMRINQLDVEFDIDNDNQDPNYDYNLPNQDEIEEIISQGSAEPQYDPTPLVPEEVLSINNLAINSLARPDSI